MEMAPGYIGAGAAGSGNARMRRVFPVFQRKSRFNFLPFPLSSQGLLQVSQRKLPVDLAPF